MTKKSLQGLISAYTVGENSIKQKNTLQEGDKINKNTISTWGFNT